MLAWDQKAPVQMSSFGHETVLSPQRDATFDQQAPWNNAVPIYLQSSVSSSDVARDPKSFHFPFRPAEHWQRVRLRVEHPMVKREEVIVREQQKQIFEPERSRGSSAFGK
jgi:hypothetical protein